MRAPLFNISDEDLFLHIVRDSDRQAFNALFDRYWKKLYASAFARLGQEQEAKDCVQDVFIQLWTKRTQLTIPSSVSGYLYTAVKNGVFNKFKAQAVRDAHLQNYIAEFEQSFATNNELEKEELDSIISSEIESMPEQMRKVFLLSRYEEMSGSEIADLLDLSHQTVRNHISMALKRLRLQIRRYELQ